MVHTAKKIVVVGGGDTSIDVASVARRLGHIQKTAEKDATPHDVLGYTAHDVAGTIQREGVQSVLTSLFPIENMTAAEREREDALREGVDIKGSVMPLEVIVGADGQAIGLKMCECDMKGMTPIAREGTEFVIDCDIIVSAIGQMGDLASGLEALDNGRGFIATDPFFRVKDHPKHFAGGDIIRPHLLTTAIGHGSIAAESIDDFLTGHSFDKRPKVDVHHFSLLDELRQRGHEPEAYAKGQIRGTDSGKFAIHNYEDRSGSQIIPYDELFLGHFKAVERARRDEKHVSIDNVIGNFEERITGLTEAEAQHEGKRCMSCGLCFECDNCVVFCPQTAVFKVRKTDYSVGRHVDTDYGKCVGCHICADVCPTGYIQMGLGE